MAVRLEMVVSGVPAVPHAVRALPVLMASVAPAESAEWPVPVAPVVPGRRRCCLPGLAVTAARVVAVAVVVPVAPAVPGSERPHPVSTVTVAPVVWPVPVVPAAQAASV